MAKIVMVGAGIVGLGAALMLAADGHDVVVLERDSASPPPDAVDAWDSWERRGVNQFRLPHGFMSRFRQIVEFELPEVAAAMHDGGALRWNPLRSMPDVLSGGWREGDEQFELVTGRRPFMEAVVARLAEETPGLELRRGCAVVGLITGSAAAEGAVHVIGVETEIGERLEADLVVDVGGRRSALPRWLETAGGRPPVEELDDSGFTYYGRHFRSLEGKVPVSIGPALMHWGTISSLALPCDNGTWSLGLIAGSVDRVALALRRVERWEAVIGNLPLVAHWLDGIPLDDGVTVISKLEDRWRGFVVDGRPVATGVVAVGDAWAASNPAVGRGASIGTIHAQVLRDTIRCPGLDHPVDFALAFHQMTADRVERWYRWTLRGDRHRLAEVEAGIYGHPYTPCDPDYDREMALQRAAMADPDCLRADLQMRLVLEHPNDVWKRAGLVQKVDELAVVQSDSPALGPDRARLVAILADAG
jgi:2-polyprenyl-6-methoxyphenol hydroxylase-like FAD-dependent oxidoreductase